MWEAMLKEARAKLQEETLKAQAVVEKANGDASAENSVGVTPSLSQDHQSSPPSQS